MLSFDARCICLGLAILTAAGSASAQEPAKQWTPDGTVHLNIKDVPFSEYASKELKDGFVALQEAIITNGPPVPALDAPLAEWVKYNAAFDRVAVEPTLTWSLANYPVDVVDTRIGGVRVGIVTPKGGVPNGNKGRVLINVHGGGFMAGRGLKMGLTESAPIASLGRLKVITIDYRQAPDFQFPAASEDVEKVYRELLKTHKPNAIGIYGCSAGGALTAQSIAWFQSKGLPRPGAAGIFCASTQRSLWTGGDSDMWGSGSGKPVKALLAVPSSPAAAKHHYLSTAKADNPLAFPAVSDAVIAKFPPTLFVTGSRAMEMSSAIVSHAQMLRLGVDSQLYMIEGGWHGSFVLAGQNSPEGKAAVTYIARWFDQHLAH